MYSQDINELVKKINIDTLLKSDEYYKLTKQEPIEINSIKKFPIGISSAKTIGLSNPFQFLKNDSILKTIEFFGSSFN
jgi:hypothetical protein